MTRISQKSYASLSPFGQWIAIEQRPFERLVDSRQDRRNLRMPPLIVFYGVAYRTAIRPLFSRPARLLADRYEVQKSAGGNVVMDKVSARPHPVCDIER